MENNDRVTMLEVLDPAHERPGYWDQFRTHILENAAFELARRREAAREIRGGRAFRLGAKPDPGGGRPPPMIASIMIANESQQQADSGPRLVLEDMLGGALSESSFQAALDRWSAVQHGGLHRLSWKRTRVDGTVQAGAPHVGSASVRYAGCRNPDRGGLERAR